MTGAARRMIVWTFHYAVPAALIASWLVLALHTARWDIPMHRCDSRTGYCGKSGAPKTAMDYQNSQKISGIIYIIWLSIGIGLFVSRATGDWIDSIPVAEDKLKTDLRA